MVKPGSSDCSSDSEKGFNSVAHTIGLMTCEDLGFVKCFFTGKNY